MLPRASALYASAPRHDDIAPSDDEGESEDDDAEEGGASDDEAAAARRAALKHRHDGKAASWKLPRGWILIALIGMVIAGQYLALLVQLLGGR